MSLTYNLSRWIATATGCAAMALIGYSNVVKTLSGGLAWHSPPVLTAGGIALFGAAAIYAASRAMAQGRWLLCIGLLVAVTLSETAGAYNILEGLLLGRDARLEAIRDHNAAIDLADAQKQAADKAVDDLQNRVVAEARRGGCKAVCAQVKLQFETAKAEAQAKAKALEALGARRSETNIVATTFGVPAVVAEAAPPLMQTASLLAFSMLLLAYGHGKATPREEAPSRVPSSDDRSTQVLEEIRKSGGSLPSNQALAQILNVSEAQASKLASALVETGHLERERDGKRTRLRIVASR